MKLIKHYSLFFLLLAASVAFAQPPAKKGRMKAFKVGFFTEQLALTPTEAERFWPIYNQYEANLKAIRKDRPKKAQIEFMTDAQLQGLLNEFFSHQEQEISLQRKLVKDLDGVLPLRKIVKLQLTQRYFKRELMNMMRGKHKLKKKHKAGKEGKKRLDRSGPPRD